MMEQTNRMNVEDIAEALGNIPWLRFLLLFLCYFLGGYLIYGALYAALGSVMGDDTADQQSPLGFIIALPIILSFILMFSIVNDPDSTLAVWTSIIPFTSPVIMPARLAFNPPAWQIALSLLMLVLGFLGAIWLAGRIYRTGILLYGKKITLREMSRWILRG
jgi:ABC-2 type transport system permease protein